MEVSKIITTVLFPRAYLDVRQASLVKISRDGKCLGALGAFANILLQLYPSAKWFMNPKETQEGCKKCSDHSKY